MSDTDERLAEIKKRAAHWKIGGTITDPVNGVTHDDRA